MKAFLSSVFWLVLLIVGLVGSWMVWFRPKARPIVAVQEAIASVARDMTGKTSTAPLNYDPQPNETDLREKERVERADRERRHAAEKERAEETAREAELRGKLHSSAQETVRSVLSFPQMAKFSALQPQDDEYSISRRLGPQLWESRGITDYVDMTGKKRRSPWRVLTKLADRSGTNEIVYLEVAGTRRGDEKKALALAGGSPPQ